MAYVPAIHFSHHTCNVDHPHAGGDVARRLDLYFGKRESMGSANRPDDFWSCDTRGGGSRQRTTDRTKVTCKKCLSDLRGGRRNLYTYPAELDSWTQTQCWLACCRFHGAPSIAKDRRGTKQLLKLAADRELEHLVEVISYLPDRIEGLGTTTSRFRENLLKQVDKVPVEFRPALRAAFDEWTMAADLADEMARMLERAKANVDEVCHRIRSGWSGDTVLASEVA